LRNRAADLDRQANQVSEWLHAMSGLVEPDPLSEPAAAAAGHALATIAVLDPPNLSIPCIDNGTAFVVPRQADGSAKLQAQPRRLGGPAAVPPGAAGTT
jgi:hypothetical protein